MNLNKFFKAYLKWIENGAKHARPFKRNDGLCENLKLYCGYPYYEPYAELKRLFREDRTLNGNQARPFHDHIEDLIDEMRRNECHLNEKRIAWVKKQIASNGTFVNSVEP